MERQIIDAYQPVGNFVASYHQRLAAGVADVADLYREGSWVTFQGQTIQGKEGILAMLTSRPFAQCKRRIINVDCHPCDDAGRLLVFVNGVVDVVQQDGKHHALNFSQLMPTLEGDFYILNDMFRVAAPPQSQVTEGVPANVATTIHT